MLKSHYRVFLDALGAKLHFCAHSHHPWPDVTRAAHLQYWDDSARLADRKWDRIFGEIVPEAQEHLARHLGHPQPARIAFAPNTHEFVARLYSCLDWSRPLHVVTTGNEFHSFARQTRRLEETGRLKVTRIAAEPVGSFNLRLLAALRGPCDLLFLSHVFFDSGLVVRDLPAIVAAVPANAIVAIDGYHAFFAIPVELAPIADRVFYMAGGYKYAQAGEGACFLACPAEGSLRPAHTGWFSDFGQLSGAAGTSVGYGADAMRFWGSTFDASGIYRLNATMRLFQSLEIDADAIHHHVLELQAQFLDDLARSRLACLPPTALVPSREFARGNFCTFDLPDAEALERRLAENDVLVDRRGRRLRFGFGVYHDAGDVERLLSKLRSLG